MTGSSPISVSPAERTRRRLLEASLACIERSGLARTSLEAVAAEAGLSRATVYRHFPGGRDQVISETVTFEVGNFLRRIGDEVATEQSLEDKLVRALMVGHRAIDDHGLLQQILSTEPEALLTELAQTGPLMLAVIQGYLAEQLRNEALRPSLDPTRVAEYQARLFLSYLGSQGRWDLSDAEVVHRLVRNQFLAGTIAVTT